MSDVYREDSLVSDAYREDSFGVGLLDEERCLMNKGDVGCFVYRRTAGVSAIDR